MASRLKHVTHAVMVSIKRAGVTGALVRTTSRCGAGAGRNGGHFAAFLGIRLAAVIAVPDSVSGRTRGNAGFAQLRARGVVLAGARNAVSVEIGALSLQEPTAAPCARPPSCVSRGVHRFNRITQ